MNKDLTSGNPSTVLWKFCLPLFGSIIFQQLYNIADSCIILLRVILYRMAGCYIQSDL